ncbi:MAG TPA: M28 family peptidase, partial [Burkholderiaceae bacterium]
QQGRVAMLDPRPEGGSFYRADQFELAKVGIPSIYLRTGADYIGKAAGSAARDTAYTAEHYHKVSDTVQPNWDLSGAVEDVRLMWQVAYEVAQGKDYPQWLEGAEFKAARDAMMKAKR